MDYMTLKEAAEKWDVTPRRVNYYCASERIHGAVKMAGVWLIPKTAEKPVDGRTKTRKGAESMKLSKIMIIEDDPVIQGELQTLLNGNGYTTLGVRNFSAVTEQIQDEKPHLILLDIKLPGENGFALCSKIRTFSEVPIIFVTSCNTDMDELNSIMLGGDAFITKPYNTAILLAKIASLLKKAYPAQQQEQIAYGDAVLHLESSSLDYHGQSVELTKNELKIFFFFLKKGGNFFLGGVGWFFWDNQLYVDDNALSVNINRIREKLAGIGLTDFIKTKHRQGYTI